MRIFSRLSLIFLASCISLTINKSIYGAESDLASDEKSEVSYHQLIKVMEEIEQAGKNPILDPPSFPENTIKENYIFKLPAEIVGQILDKVTLYKDQLSFLMCTTGIKGYAKYISKTHIYNINTNEPSAQYGQPLCIDLPSNLKYLCITNCNIGNIKFGALNLKGLTVRWSNVDTTLLLDQRALSYLDVRTINIPFLDEASLSYLDIPDKSHNRMVFSCENETLLTTLHNNKFITVLKLNITNNQEDHQPNNIYENLSKLKSLELTDLSRHQDHAHFLPSLEPLNEIILSAFQVGLMEANYKDALLIIAKMPEQKHLTIKCLNDQQLWKVVYDGIRYRLNPKNLVW